MAKLTVTKSILVTAEPARVFRALTEPTEIMRFLPLRSAEIEGRLDGAITFRGEAGGIPFTDYGTIEIFDPPRVFQYRYWSDNQGVERTPENHLTIRYDITPSSANRSKLAVTHGGIPPAPYHDIMLGVWDFLLDGIRCHVEADEGRNGVNRF